MILISIGFNLSFKVVSKSSSKSYPNSDSYFNTACPSRCTQHGEREFARYRDPHRFLDGHSLVQHCCAVRLAAPWTDGPVTCTSKAETSMSNPLEPTLFFNINSGLNWMPRRYLPPLLISRLCPLWLDSPKTFDSHCPAAISKLPGFSPRPPWIAAFP